MCFYRWIAFLCILSFLGKPGFSQTNRYYQQLTSDSISVRFNGAYRLALSYRRTQQDSARYFASKAAELLPKLDSTQRIQAFSVQGLVAYESGAYDDALSFFKQAEQEARRQNSPRLEARNVNRQGNAYTMLGQTPRAIERYQRAIHLAEKENLPEEAVYFVQSLAFCYQKNGAPEKAIPYFEDALAYFREQENWAGVISTNNLLHIAWSNMDSLDRALELVQSNLAPPLSQYLSPKDSATMLHNLGRLYNMRGQYEAAGQVLRSAITIKEKQNNPESTIKSWIEWITSLNAQGDYSEAYTLAHQLDTSILNNSSIYTRRDYYRHLSKIMAQRGVYAEAYRYQGIFDSLDQVIFNRENKESIAELELQLAQKQNEQLAAEARTATQQRNWVILSGLLLILLIGSYLFFRQRELRRQKIWTARQLQLKETQYEARTRFFTNISHELRTPLTLIQAPAQSLLHQLTEPRQQKLVHTILRNSRDMNQLIDQTLSLEQKPETADILRLSPIEIDTFLSELVAPFTYLARERSISFTYHNQLGKAWLQFDPLRTRHILRNLLNNAFKFTPAHKTISLSVRQQHNKLHIEVKDTGPGIHPSDLPHIFERFYRGQNNNRHTPPGTGIGLHLAREFARLQDGDLTVQSTTGAGSSFVCTLPWIPGKRAMPVATDSPPAPQGRPPANAPILLIVEDHPDMQQYLAQVLAGTYHLLQAENGLEAMDILTREKVDLILSDVMMPGMDGFALLQALKKDDQLASIPIMLLTARSEPNDKLNALTAGVDDYLHKPFHPGELTLQIEHLLQFKQNRLQGDLPKQKEVGSPPTAPSASDQKWLKEVEHIMKTRMAHDQFSIAIIAEELNMSERQLYRRIKRIAGLTPNRFLREVKLKEARRMLTEGIFPTVAEVSFAIGIDTPEYFSKIFKERYGCTPSNLLNH